LVLPDQLENQALPERQVHLVPMVYLGKLGDLGNLVKKDHLDQLVREENLEFLEHLDCQDFLERGDCLDFLACPVSKVNLDLWVPWALKAIKGSKATQEMKVLQGNKEGQDLQEDQDALALRVKWDQLAFQARLVATDYLVGQAYLALLDLLENLGKMGIKVRLDHQVKRDSRAIKVQVVPLDPSVHEDLQATKELKGRLVIRVCEEKWEDKGPKEKMAQWE